MLEDFFTVLRRYVRPTLALTLLWWAYFGDPVSFLERAGLSGRYTWLELWLYDNLPTAVIPVFLFFVGVAVSWLAVPIVYVVVGFLFGSRLKIPNSHVVVVNVLPDPHQRFAFLQYEVQNHPLLMLGPLSDRRYVKVRMGNYTPEWNPGRGSSWCPWLRNIENKPWTNVRRIELCAGDEEPFAAMVLRDEGWCFAPAFDFEGTTNLRVVRPAPTDFYAVFEVKTNATWAVSRKCFRIRINGQNISSEPVPFYQAKRFWYLIKTKVAPYVTRQTAISRRSP